MKPATAQVLRYLERNGSITPMQALNELGCYRLGARIWELRHLHGYTIPRETVTAASGKHYAKYTIATIPEQMVVGL